MDRTEVSETYGCGERYFWKYKLHDYPNARFQESALFLALLQTVPLEDNVYYGKLPMAEWTLAACGYWLSVRNGDGSCQEAYPHERSFCATSFSTWCVCRALGELHKTDAAPLVDRFLEQSDFLAEVLRTGNWLRKHLHFRVANQAAAAALSMQMVANLTGERTFAEQAAEVVEKLLRRAGPEGRFVEYDGFDLGYATITMSCLSWYAEVSGREAELDAQFRNICEGYDSMIGRNGRFDPSEMSRGTAYLYPHAFARYSESAMEKIGSGLESGRMLAPTWLDDRYCIGMATDYLKAVGVLTRRTA